MMQVDKHDTLIERLEKAIGYAENNAFFTARELCAPAMREALKALKQSQWTRIEDIPEEWMDGREVELWVRYLDESGGIRLGHCNYRSGNFTTPDYELDEMGVYATHVMLTPHPPKG